MESPPATTETRHPSRRRGMRWLLFIGLPVLLLIVGVIVWIQRRLPSASDIATKPITIVAREESASRYPWSFRVNSNGKAELGIGFDFERKRPFTVSDEHLQELRKLLIRERFFELGDEYGERVLDGSEDILTITMGQSTKTVRIGFLMNWVSSERAKLREPARAIRVWMLVRGWFSDPDVADLRKYDQMVLDAAGR
jgi:hypothetical protein